MRTSCDGSVVSEAACRERIFEGAGGIARGSGGGSPIQFERSGALEAPERGDESVSAASTWKAGPKAASGWGLVRSAREMGARGAWRETWEPAGISASRGNVGQWRAYL